MQYQIQLSLSDEWTVNTETVTDDYGRVTGHLEASRPDGSFIDISLGEMPEGETAQDQAFANYIETVGFSEDDPEDYNPIARLKFNGKNAWGFDAYLENDVPMRLISQEPRAGVLAIMVFSAPDRDELVNLHLLIERNFRVKAK